MEIDHHPFWLRTKHTYMYIHVYIGEKHIKGNIRYKNERKYLKENRYSYMNIILYRMTKIIILSRIYMLEEKR